MLKKLYIFEKRVATKIRMYKKSSFYVKIGLWILTTNFTKTAFIKKEKALYNFKGLMNGGHYNEVGPK